MKQRLFQLAVVIAFLAVAAIATRGFLRSRSAKIVPVKSMDSWQNADAPIGFPVGGSEPAFDSRFIQLTAFERAQIPTATHMTEAMGTEHGALTYNAQPFWSDNPQRGGHHSGDDINGIGGMNTDLGDPVYAIGSGLVIYRGEPSPGWGNMAILAHRTRSGDIKLSMYAHLQKIYAAYGDTVPRGDTIGTVGTAHLRYPAHLHLEVIDSTGVHIGHGYTRQKGQSINPSATITRNQGSSADHLYSPPLDIVISENLSYLLDKISIQSK